jgi:FKBP-type peptidyl-prolyl cis-trans isomerase
MAYINFMSKKIIFLLLVLIVIGVGFYFFGLKSKTTPAAVVVSPSPAATSSATIQKVDGLIIEDITIGTGAEAVAGKLITVNYLGTLLDGTKFDSSYDRGAPFQFTLGAGEVIKGWDEGFTGMKIGGKRKLTISPELGYGNVAMGTIPANSTLVFEVELLKVE